MRAATVLCSTVVLLVSAGVAQSQNLEGYADMHTHPMSHLAFGGMIVFGAPDTETLMLSGQKYRGWHSGEKNCWLVNEEAGALEFALGFDNAVHGAPGWGTTSYGDANNCGDLIRSAMIDKLEEKYIHKAPNPGLPQIGDHRVNDHPHHGYPNFQHWPHWSSVTHQQMYWEWIKRAHDGGLRVMVALAVNNTLLAKAANASQYVDDKSSVRLQIDEIKKFVLRHHVLSGGFMELAYTSEDLRRIVAAGHLAVVLGVETDDFGNLTKRATSGETITAAKVATEIRDLHGMGVRYLLPIHFSNTVLGGYAITRDLFALSTREYTGAHPVTRNSCPRDGSTEGIHFNLKQPELGDPEKVLLRTRGLGPIIDTQPPRPAPPAGCGHANSLPLSPLGRSALTTMMNLGMIIDVDHMSRLAVDQALGFANDRNYPLVSGHNGPLAADCMGPTPANPQSCNEQARTPAQYEAIRRVGGMVGIGHGGTATNFVRTYQRILNLMGNRPVAIGTDVNGLEAMPSPDPDAPVTYRPGFERYRFANRTWDINSVTREGKEVGDGVSHYGLMTDWIKSWQTNRTPGNRMTARGMDAFMGSAEGFARTWERAARRSAGPPRTANLDQATTWCTAPGDVLHAADFNGDGAADLLCRNSRRLLFDYADAFGVLGGATDATVESTWCTHAGAVLHLADFNGDGRTDFLCRDPGRVWFSYADKQGRFNPAGSASAASSWCTQAGAALQIGDANGDGRSDLICRTSDRLEVKFASNGSPQFREGATWQVNTHWCTHSNAKVYFGDFSGDGRMDILCKDPQRIWFNHADETGNFNAAGTGTLDTTVCTHADTTIHVADFNGDGRSDLLCRDPNRLWISYANDRGSFGPAPDWFLDTRWCTEPRSQLMIADVNGDNQQDLLCHSPTAIRVDYASNGPRPDRRGRFERTR